MRQSEQIGKLAVALVAAQGEMKAIVKDSANPAFKSSYASLEATVDAVRPILSKHGLAVLQGESNPETDEGKLTGFNVETLILHTSGEWISNAVYVPVEKPSAQGAVSALTYGRRAGLRAVFTLADTDDDGETAQNHAPIARQSAPAKAPATTPAKAASRTMGPVTGDNVPPCNKCGGPVWDNRLDKRNPKAPDFKCKDKACDGAIWLESKKAAPAPAPVAAGSFDDEPNFDEDGLPF